MAKITEIIRRGTHAATAKTNERLVYVRNGESVSPPGFLERPFTDVWVVDVDSRLGADEPRSVQIDLALPSGERTRLVLSYSGIRAAAGREALLVLALANAADPQQELEGKLVAQLEQMVSSGSFDVVGAWTRCKTALEQTLRQWASERLGLFIQIGLQPNRRPDPTPHMDLKWNLRVGKVEEAQSFKVGFTIEDDVQRLPTTILGDEGEVDIVREAVAQACLDLSFDEFRRGTNVRARLASAASRALVPAARKVTAFKIELEGSGPDENVLTIETEAKHVAGVIKIKLSAVRQIIDADDARNYELRDAKSFIKLVGDMLREVAERTFAGQGLYTIYHDNGALMASIRKEICEWVRAETGYRFLDYTLSLTEPPQSPPQYVRVTAKDFETDPIIGKKVKIEVRVVAELRDLQAWFNAGSPNIENFWLKKIKEQLETALHTQDDADALRHSDAVQARIRAHLEQIGRDTGYAPTDYRMVIRCDIPHAEREIMVHVPPHPVGLGAMGRDTLSLGVSMRLKLIDDWAYVAGEKLRKPGWADELLRGVIAEELRFRSRSDLRLHQKDIESAIATRLERQVGDRGYAVHGVRIDGMELTPASERVHRRLDVTSELLRVDDLATWSGTVDVELHDLSRWTQADEPDIESVLESLVQRCFEAVCRESQPGAVDEKPELVVGKFREHVRAEVEKIGYRLSGLVGRIAATHAPEPDRRVDHTGRYKVGQREVEVKATIVMRLVQAGLWRACAVRDLEQWVHANVRSVLQSVLLERSYAEVLSDVVLIHHGGEASVSKLVRKELSSSAEKIGYSVAQVLAIPDSEARTLLRDVDVDFKETLATKWSQREVHMQVHVSGKFDSFDGKELNGVLSRGDDVKAWLKMEIVRELAVQLRELTPNDVFFRWEGEQATRPRLATAIAARLRDLTMVAPIVQLTAHPPGYIENLKPLCGNGPYWFTIATNTPYGSRNYRAMFQVEGLHEEGADNWFRRTEPLTAERLGEVLAGLLSNMLGRRRLSALGVDDEPAIEELEASAADVAMRRCGVILGLLVRVFGLERVVSGSDQDALWARLQQQRMLAMEAGDLPKIEQITRMLGSLALEVGSGDRKPVLPFVGAETLDVKVMPPDGGYRSVDPGYPFPLEVMLRVTPRTTASLPKNSIVELARGAVGGMLSTVDPVEYWMAFEQSVGGRLSLRARVEQAIALALKPHETAMTVEIGVAPPAASERLRIRKMCADVITPEHEFITTFERIPIKIRATYTVVDAAPGRWHRVMQSQRDEASRTRWTLDWLERHLATMVREELRQQPAQTLAPGFAAAFADEFGLTAVLHAVDVALDHRQRELLLTELERLDAEIAVLQTKSDTHAQMRLDELRSHRARLLDDLARIEVSKGA